MIRELMFWLILTGCWWRLVLPKPPAPPVTFAFIASTSTTSLPVPIGWENECKHCDFHPWRYSKIPPNNWNRWPLLSRSFPETVQEEGDDDNYYDETERSFFLNDKNNAGWTENSKPRSFSAGKLMEQTADRSNIQKTSNDFYGEHSESKSSTESTRYPRKSGGKGNKQHQLQYNMGISSERFTLDEISNDLSPIVRSSSSSEIRRGSSKKKITTRASVLIYLRDELGFSHEEIHKIQRMAPSAFGMKTEILRRKVEVLQQELGLTQLTELRQLIKQTPMLLHLSAQKNILPTIQLLRQLLDLKQEENSEDSDNGRKSHKKANKSCSDGLYLKSLVLACPSILTYSKATLKAKIGFFTNAKTMGNSVEELRKLLLSEPKLLRSSVQTGLVPHYRFFRRELNLPRESIRRIVMKNPRLLLYSLDQNLVPKLVFFGIMTLHMEISHLERLLLSYPEFLDFHLERHTLPLARYFLNDLEFSPTEFRTILLAYPRIVTHSLSTVKHTAGWFRYNELNFTGTQVKRILYQAPQTCALTDINIRQKIDFLKQFLSLEDESNYNEKKTNIDTEILNPKEDLKKILVGMPRLLVLNVDRNLKPKLLYLLQAMNGDVDELRAAVIRLPALLGYSLEARIKPRMDMIQNYGLPASSITVGIPMGKDKFEAWLMAKSLASENGKRMGGVLPRGRKILDSRKVDNSGSMLDYSSNHSNNPRKKPSRIIHRTRARKDEAPSR